MLLRYRIVKFAMQIVRLIVLTRIRVNGWENIPEIPYIVHPLAVASLLIRVGSPEPLVIAALLHDVVEDTPLTIREIRARFGPEVAELVSALSEPDKKASWEDRKTHTIEYLENKANADVLMVALADKLDNIRAIREGLETDGEMFWARFNRPREKQLTLLSTFRAEVKRVFQDC